MAEPGAGVKTAKKRSRFSVCVEIVMLAALIVGAFFLLRTGYRRYMLKAYPMLYTEAVQRYADEYGITPSLIYGIIRTESEFNPNAVSSANAKGLMQLTDATFDWAQQRSPDKEDLPPEQLFDPEINIHYGTYVLLLLNQQYANPDTALAAYNAGIGNVNKWLKDPECSDDGLTLKAIPYKETADYVQRVRKAQEMYRELYDIP